ncbi:APC family permease [Catenulispora pinisilvae]|uniref:APC family permease n=1 Tax=Catenulispora pinisilvae TaxID=2705253 RepID=UPI0018918BC0|nr:APC family permease [Catenulispora pinisilvae]
MSETTAPATPSTGSEAGTGPGGLRRGALSSIGAAIVAMAFMGPATSIFFNTPLAAQKSGYAMPVGIALAMLACLIIASTIAAFSRKLPATGFAFTFTTHAFGKGAGFLTGWLLILAYAATGPMLFSAIGGFGSQFLSTQFHWHVKWAIVSLVFVAVVWFIASRGIGQSTKAALIFLTLELGVLLALFGTVLVKGGAGGNSLSIQPFNPGHSLTGLSGIGFAMLWGVLMFVGFESAGTLAEETRDPRKGVPFALFAAVLMIGVVYVLAGYVAAIGFGSHGSADLAGASDPWTTISNTFWSGKVAWIIALTVINSQFANVLAGSTAGIRMLFALGREGLLPRLLGRTDRNGTPQHATAVYMIMATVITLTLSWWQTPMGAYGLLGSVLGIAMILIYIAMNIGLIRYYLRSHRDQFSWLRHGALPALGSLLMLLPIYGQLWPIPTWPSNGVPYLILIWLLVGGGYFIVVRRRTPERIEAMGRVWGAE